MNKKWVDYQQEIIKNAKPQKIFNFKPCDCHTPKTNMSESKQKMFLVLMRTFDETNSVFLQRQLYNSFQKYFFFQCLLKQSTPLNTKHKTHVAKTEVTIDAGIWSFRCTRLLSLQNTHIIEIMLMNVCMLRVWFG